MTPARIAIILVALVAAVGLALVVHSMIGSPKPPPPAAVVAQQAPMTRVLVAKVDLGVGDRLSTDNMSWQSWPAATLNAAYITDGQAAAPAPATPTAAAVDRAGKAVTDMATGGGAKMQSMIGATVREAIFAGEPITSKKIVRAGDSGYMAVRLPAGMRAVALPVSVESGVAGFIQPGDRVDVFSTHADTGKSGGGGMITETVITNALVLAVDQHTDAPKAGSTIIGATITLEVPNGNVIALARARTQSGLTVALRSYADGGGVTAGPSSDDGRSVRIFKGGATAEVVTAQ
jgi:pilus assembly protein CpaB